MPIKQIIFVEIKHFLLGAACYAHKKICYDEKKPNVYGFSTVDGKTVQ